MNALLPQPLRGEVWRVSLDPVRGSEQAKTRPVVVLSQPPVGRATVRLCAPVIHHQPGHIAFFWCVTLHPTTENGLSKASSVDAAQTRALDVARFETKLGNLTPGELEAITTALILCVGRLPSPSTEVPNPHSR